MDRLLALARSQPSSPDFRAALLKHLPEDEIKAGTAFNSNGPDFIWAVETAKTPALVIDDGGPVSMRRITGTDTWFHVGQLKVGTGHRFHYVIEGARFGGSVDVPAYTPDSYARPGVPAGRLAEKLVHRSKLYEGMETT